jgi:ankyrin repeat protein
MIFMRHVRSPSDPNHILNSFNKYGQNSLYIAAKNGHFNVI